MSTNSHAWRAAVALALALLVGLAVGTSASTASSRLTAKSVKKIATKVVHKNAAKLSVAHASTADTAVTASHAGGVWRFTLPSQPLATARTYRFPGLPAGTYLAGYSLTIGLTTGTAMQCVFETTAGPEATDNVTAASNLATPSGPAVVTTGSNLDLLCNAGAFTWTVQSGYNSTVSFVPISSPTGATATGT